MIKLITDTAKIDVTFTKADKSLKTFSEMVHVGFASLLDIVNTESGNREGLSLLNKHFRSMPVSIKQALKVYIIHFGKVEYDKPNNVFNYNEKRKINAARRAEMLIEGPVSFQRKAKDKKEETEEQAAKKAMKALERHVDAILESPALNIETLGAAIKTLKNRLETLKALTHTPEKVAEIVKPKRTRSVKTMAELKSVIAA